MPKSHANAKQNPETELLQFENYILHRHYHLKIVGDILKISKITSVSVTMRLMITRMKIKMKTKSHREDIYVFLFIFTVISTNRPRSTQGRKYGMVYTKYGQYKKCLSIMMLLCVKQHLRNT